MMPPEIMPELKSLPGLTIGHMMDVLTPDEMEELAVRLIDAARERRAGVASASVQMLP